MLLDPIIRWRIGAALVVWLVIGPAQHPARAGEFVAEPNQASAVAVPELPPPAADAPDGADSAAPAGRPGLDEVARELRRIADQYGPDSVALQAKFLLRSTTAGATGPIEVKVAGPSEHLGAEYLEIIVDTGLSFVAADGRTMEQRADHIWTSLAAPALEEMTSFDLKPGGLEVVFLYRVEDPPSPSPGQVEEVAVFHAEQLMVALDRALLDSVAHDLVAGEALRKAVRFEASAPVR